MVVLAVARVLVGLLFVFTGALQLARHAEFALLFTRWHVPAAGNAVTVVAALQFVCGILLTAGILTRPVALLLATLMVGAVMTAGRVDGGIHLIVPPVLFVLCVLLAWRSGRFPGATPARPPGVQ